MKYFKAPLPEFSDENVWKELKLKCYDGTIDYNDFPADEYKYFDRLRITYLEYKSGVIPKDDAAARERMLLKEYRHSKQAAARSLEVYQTYQSNIKRLDSLRIEINKAETVEDKLRPALEIVGIVTGDEGFERRNVNI